MMERNTEEGRGRSTGNITSPGFQERRKGGARAQVEGLAWVEKAFPHLSWKDGGGWQTSNLLVEK